MNEMSRLHEIDGCTFGPWKKLETHQLDPYECLHAVQECVDCGLRRYFTQNGCKVFLYTSDSLKWGTNECEMVRKALESPSNSKGE